MAGTTFVLVAVAGGYIFGSHAHGQGSGNNHDFFGVLAVLRETS
jgi:hypothetical protein